MLKNRQKNLNLDSVLLKIPGVRAHPRFQRLAKFILSAFIIYFVFKVPIMWFLTDLLAVHYIWSGFVAGSILTLLSFIPSEFWVWKKKL